VIDDAMIQMTDRQADPIRVQPPQLYRWPDVLSPDAPRSTASGLLVIDKVPHALAGV